MRHGVGAPCGFVWINGPPSGAVHRPGRLRAGATDASGRRKRVVAVPGSARQPPAVSSPTRVPSLIHGTLGGSPSRYLVAVRTCRWVFRYVCTVLRLTVLAELRAKATVVVLPAVSLAIF